MRKKFIKKVNIRQFSQEASPYPLQESSEQMMRATMKTRNFQSLLFQSSTMGQSALQSMKGSINLPSEVQNISIIEYSTNKEQPIFVTNTSNSKLKMPYEYNSSIVSQMSKNSRNSKISQDFSKQYLPPQHPASLKKQSLMKSIEKDQSIQDFRQSFVNGKFCQNEKESLRISSTQDIQERSVSFEKGLFKDKLKQMRQSDDSNKVSLQSILKNNFQHPNSSLKDTSPDESKETKKFKSSIYRLQLNDKSNYKLLPLVSKLTPLSRNQINQIATSMTTTNGDANKSRNRKLISDSLQDAQSVNIQHKRTQKERSNVNEIKLENIKKQMMSTFERSQQLNVKAALTVNSVPKEKKSRNNLVFASSGNNKDLQDLLDTKVRIHKTLKPHNQARQRDFSQSSNQKPLITQTIKSKVSQEEAIEVSSLNDDSSTNNKDDIKQPISPLSAIEQLGQEYLTQYELVEIMQFKEIYYVNRKEKIDEEFYSKSGTSNHGFDDEQNYYRFRLGDQLMYRFEIIEKLGKGSFGQVLRCFDHKTKEEVAVKIIRNQSKFHKQAMVELKILETLNDSDKPDKKHIVRVKEAFLFRNHLCITFEMLNVNLYEMIKACKHKVTISISITPYQGFDMQIIKNMALQLLIALRFLKKQKVIHCDLKPENILLKHYNKSMIKVIDFGSSCMIDERIYTYIQSRFYRAPEIVLGISYDYQIDMWSFGCIMCELFTGYPIFPGESESEQIMLFMEIIGRPPKKFIQSAQRASVFFQDDHETLKIDSKKKFSITHIQHALNTTDQDFLDFVSKCLQWDPKQRMTCEQALDHKFIQEILKKIKK